MSSQRAVVNAANAASYIGQTVLAELILQGQVNDGADVTVTAKGDNLDFHISQGKAEPAPAKGKRTGT